jgi:hypothetical protein
MKYLVALLLCMAPFGAHADERADLASATLNACFEAAETPELELRCLATAVRACTPDVQNPRNPDLLPCIAAETAVWRDRGDGRLADLEDIIHESAATDTPCTPTVEDCVAQVQDMDRRMRTQGELACEQAAQVAALDGVPDLGRAACMMREMALRSVRLAGLRQERE